MQISAPSPVYKRLLEYGEVKGLAVGAFGGFSMYACLYTAVYHMYMAVP